METRYITRIYIFILYTDGKKNGKEKFDLVLYVRVKFFPPQTLINASKFQGKRIDTIDWSQGGYLFLSSETIGLPVKQFFYNHLRKHDYLQFLTLQLSNIYQNEPSTFPILRLLKTRKRERERKKRKKKRREKKRRKKKLYIFSTIITDAYLFISMTSQH